MNKNIIHIAAAGLISISMASCGSDFLEVSSKTDASTGNYNQTATQAQILLNGCYDGWQGTVAKGPTFTFQLASEYMSDECYGGTGANDQRNTQVIDRFDVAQDVSQTNLYDDLWTYYYAAIYNCNELIHLEGQYSWTEEEHGRIMGECRAIRALCYFDLVRMFENVPLMTEPVDVNAPQADPDSVYSLIVSDLRYAATHIPAGAYPKSQAATNDGHVTKYGAEAMLARVYLFYDGVYNNNQRGTMPGGLTAAEALAGLEDVIGSGEFGLVPLYKNLWPASANCSSYKGYWLGDVEGGTKNSDYAGAGNAETVLSMKFNYTGDYNGNSAGNRTVLMLGLRTGGGGHRALRTGMGSRNRHVGHVELFRHGGHAPGGFHHQHRPRGNRWHRSLSEGNAHTARVHRIRREEVYAAREDRRQGQLHPLLSGGAGWRLPDFAATGLHHRAL